MTRQAAVYRARRVLLAGDAAHVHYPAGGQGLSLGVQDAVNLGWKLAQVVRGDLAGQPPRQLSRRAPPCRRPSASHTMAQTALQRGDERMKALIDVVSRAGHHGGASQTTSPAPISGLDIHYDLGEGHPLLGRRMPDLDLVTADGSLTCLRVAARRPAAAARTSATRAASTSGLERPGPAGRGALRRGVGAAGARRGRRPQRGADRPDGYVAWVGDGTDTGLGDALTMWFGAATVSAA